MRQLAFAGVALLVIGASNAYAAPITIDGITFPQGEASFADAVVSFAPGPDVGGTYANPSSALGLPDYNASAGTGATSLGQFGNLVVRFTDNSLTTSGDSTPDLHIFEIGASTEFFKVEISKDGGTWLNLGNVLGQPTSIDIDAAPGIIAGALYSWVRLSDVRPSQSPFPFGEADIDAVGAISSGAPIPEPGTLSLLGLALLSIPAVRRRRGASSSMTPDVN
jgi:hypothetical protein